VIAFQVGLIPDKLEVPTPAPVPEVSPELFSFSSH
jgi:hypothetical protein